MNNFKNQGLSFVTIATFFISVIVSNCYANDSERINRLENEIQEIKRRLSIIESPQSASPINTKPAAVSDGWKHLPNWRQLKTGMSPAEVKAILGEPNKVNGGEVATWRYTNGGTVGFISDKLLRWNEP